MIVYATTMLAMLPAAAGPVGSIDVLLQLGVSLAVFFAVFLFVLAAFGQPGKVQLSPQREAALLTGHTDRRTVFEKPVLKSFMWLLLVMGHRLSWQQLKNWLQRKLIAAGNPDYYTPEEYLAVSMLTGVTMGVCVGLLAMILTDGQISIVWPIIGFFVGTGLAIYQLHDKASKRLLLISKRVPYALDLISLAMGAGATFTEAAQTVVREEGDDPFNEELRALLAEMDLGTTRRRALENMAERVPLDQLRSVVSSVIQAEELGTPLADVLHSQANLLRLQRTVNAENAAATASVKILIPSLLILMAVVLAVFAPMIVRGFSGRGLF